MPTPEELYADELEQIARRFVTLEDTTVKGMVELLQQLRRDISERLGEVDGFDIFRLRELQARVNDLIVQFGGQLTGQLGNNLRDGYALGEGSVVAPLSAADVVTPEMGTFFQPSAAQVNAVVGFSADLVTNITDDLRGKINTQLRLATLGERSPFEAMREITTVLGVKASDGVWGLRNRPEVVSGVAARAETIVRTELTRTFNLAGHSTQLQAAEVAPGLMKRWVATGDGRTRATHLAAHVRYRDNPIPVDKAYIVGGEEMMYPGDPRGSAQNTINCRCRSLTVAPSIGVVDTDMDRLIDAERERRAEEAMAA